MRYNENRGIRYDRLYEGEVQHEGHNDIERDDLVPLGENS